MEEPKRAETVAEALAQDLEMPAFEHWRYFAGRLNGYELAKELGFDLGEWASGQERRWRSTGQWDLDLLHLRIMLFFTFRSDYWSGYTYTEHDDMAESLLQAISKASGKPYPPPE